MGYVLARPARPVELIGGSPLLRRHVLARAIEREQSVSALARRYEMSLTAVQKHVAVLERAALVSKHRSGREQRVAANPETLRKATTLLAAFEQLWIKRATKIAEILAEEDDDAHHEQQ